MHIHFRTILSLALASLMIANPALAQSIDLSPVQNLLQGIVDTITGPLGIVIGTLALIGVFLSWLFGILDFRQALWVLVAIAGSVSDTMPTAQDFRWMLFVCRTPSKSDLFDVPERRRLSVVSLLPKASRKA